MNNFEIIIGIENHVELKTKTKMFSPAPVTYGKSPNTQVHEIDLAYPGTLPRVNKQAVKLALLACQALSMHIDELLRFDRKNYFYPDLTKGYQITQQFHPIGTNGVLTIEVAGETKKIAIERLHIEEDTAKQIHKNDLTYLDYNRAGTALVEIVTKPVMHSAQEACAYVEKLREILLFLNVSDVKMNEGSLRTDVNISLRPFGATTYSNKVEIKNLNSIANIKKAVEFEVARQTQILLADKIVTQETRRFDDTTNTTIAMRAKTDAIDYKYFREPNIAPIQLDSQWIADVLKNAPELADQKRAKYCQQYGLVLHDANIILASLETTHFFEATLQHTKDYAKIANFLISDIQAFTNKHNITINQTYITPVLLAELINLINQGIISSKHSKTILPMLLSTKQVSVEAIIDQLQLRLITDSAMIETLLNPIIKANQALLTQYSERPERVIKTLMGQLMKQTNGNVDPEKATHIITSFLENKNNH